MKKKLRSLLAALLLPLVLSACGPMTDPAADTPLPERAGLEVHFIDVGQADSALLLCGGESMLIDGGNVEDSSLVVSCLRDQGVEVLDYMVCTHAHEDHVGGLSGPLNTLQVEQVVSSVTQYNSGAFENFLAGVDRQGISLHIPAPDESFSLGDATVTVLGPRQDYEDANNTSIVLRVDYGATSFLFTGDMERDAEADLIAAGCDLMATVLKVGHHGSSTSSSYAFLREVMPEYAVISVGAGNSYGHPHDEVLSRLYDADTTVYRTDLLGCVVAVSDGLRVTFSTERGGTPLPGRGTEAADVTYIANRKSLVFHTETCSGLPGEQNRVYFDSRAAALAEGYRPCGNCKP